MYAKYIMLRRCVKPSGVAVVLCSLSKQQDGERLILSDKQCWDTARLPLVETRAREGWRGGDKSSGL